MHKNISHRENNLYIASTTEKNNIHNTPNMKKDNTTHKARENNMH